MSKISNITHYYFLGIGGIGMSALARYLGGKGFYVEGYDKTETSLTNELQNEGIRITFNDDINQINEQFINCSAEHKIVIYTPAIPTDSILFKWFKNQGYTTIKRAELLALLCEGMPLIAVAGTHGKTSTTTLLAHLFSSSNIPFSAFLGGISVNFNSNFISNSNDENRWMIAEADEYDRSFHQLKPNIAIITSIEPDHLDIYGNYENLLNAFAIFASGIKKGGTLILHESLRDKLLLPDEIIVKYYGSISDNQFFYNQVKIVNHKFQFDLPKQDWFEMVNGIAGKHNIENSCAALAVLQTVVPDMKNPTDLLQTFKGVKRRFELIFEDEKHCYIDDYAHHPSEIQTAIDTARSLYPTRKLTVIFQPHLFSRTRDLAEGFARILSSADSLIIMPIYPAREQPISGITSEWLLGIAGHGSVLNHDGCVSYIDKNLPELLLTLGAGSIDILPGKIHSIYQNNAKVQ